MVNTYKMNDMKPQNNFMSSDTEFRCYWDAFINFPVASQIYWQRFIESDKELNFKNLQEI